MMSRAAWLDVLHLAKMMIAAAVADADADDKLISKVRCPHIILYGLPHNIIKLGSENRQ